MLQSLRQGSQMKTTGFIYDESYFWHDNGSGALTMKAISGTITAQVHCI
jgi:hypothetical protein